MTYLIALFHCVVVVQLASISFQLWCITIQLRSSHPK